MNDSKYVTKLDYLNNKLERDIDRGNIGDTKCFLVNPLLLKEWSKGSPVLP
jgi:hypothetical protein